ncbi:MAG: pyrroloquinoline quinone biosynthesis protein PqqE [Candidatus Eremiobacteraeota bacterium]|nr:pyrroloquinoline quinone biosynthesis protein PqqE [Candidatus Eremiobacteraeota bacterium]MBV8498372.1 pyrroloquinoline quinone biosynthesis protein PqqE [Candidatus Eremiobacteraeota bacterium]
MTKIGRPMSLLCEITYRCNLQCPYCYNPLSLRDYRDELSTEQWCVVLAQAAELGVVQTHFSGGEPTLRRDLPAMVAFASGAGLYTNLITQGTFLEDALLDELLAAGLDHVQISIQAPEAALADRIAGTTAHARKLEALERALRRDVAVTLNCVLHRLNHDAIGDAIALAERLGVRRLELANVQFYGWAYRNRLALMPTREQVERGEAVVTAARERLRGAMEIAYVPPDYFDDFPKPCMNGWGRQFMTVTPNGMALPCPAAAAIRTLHFENVRDRALRAIWQDSEAFCRYRGTAWMPEPCRSCDRREIDWGGCRCQAFLLTGDAGATDPVCSLSADHRLVVALREGNGQREPVARRA